MQCYCNLSAFSWGAYFGQYKIGSVWDKTVKEFNISSKELLAVCYSLNFKDCLIDKHEKYFETVRQE